MTRLKVICISCIAVGLMAPGISDAEINPATCVGMWHFDEGSGDVAEDSSGKGNHGTLISGPIWVDEGYFGKALEFAGSSSNTHVAIPDSDSLDSVEITVAAWVKPSSLEGTWNVIAEKWFNPDGEQDWLFALKKSGAVYKMNLYLTNEFNFFADSEVFPGGWSYCVFTLNDSGDIALYLNGRLDGQKRGTGGKKSSSLSTLQISDHRANGQGFKGLIDEVVIYNVALSEADINNIMKGTPAGLASNPSPADEATDVPRQAALSWTPGEYANTHDVYFGTVFGDVNEASRNDPRGVLASQGQIATTYDPPGRLDLGRTYFWRIDEVNAPPDSTIFKGDTWSFAVEPVAYPINADRITASASSASNADEGPENTINGSGLDADDLHSTEAKTMWISNFADPGKPWIQYEFDRVYKLHQMQVWNYNTSAEPVVGFGVREAVVEYSTEGTEWAPLGTTHEFARGSGTAGYAANTTINLGGVAARYVKITANSNWGGFVNQYGLSEVRFSYIPVGAREPDPASGATDVAVDATLSWRAGREATKHNVYLSTDEQAVIDGTAAVVTVTAPTYSTALDLVSTYYWRVDEVNETEATTTWQGDLWSLSTQEYLVVDDFESYNDIEAGQEGSNLVYETWADGYANPAANGSTIGYTEAFQPSMETATVFDGKQSVPLVYNNTTASISEITASTAKLLAGTDWSKHGIKGLTLRFSGDPANALQQLYVKINSKKVAYDGSAENLRLKAWQMWYIDLASLGTNLSNVSTLTIGLERIGAVGGQGKILLDGIRLYSYDRQLITPVDPGAAGLQGQYEFEGNANDSSGKGRNGTAMGGALFTAGQTGQAISLDGLNDYVTITGYKGILGSDPFTITAWINTSDVEGTIVGWGSTAGGTTRVEFRIDADRLRCESSGAVQGDTTLPDNEWVHVAVTVKAGAVIDDPDVTLYLDGRNDTSVSTGAQNPLEIAAGYDVTIGRRHSGESRWLAALIDGVRIYNYELSQEEIAWLAGRTQPFDKPF